MDIIYEHSERLPIVDALGMLRAAELMMWDDASEDDDEGF